MNEKIFENNEQIIQKLTNIKQNRENIKDDLESVFQYIDLLNESTLDYDEESKKIAKIIFDVYYNFMDIVDTSIAYSGDLYIISKSIIYFNKLNSLFCDGVDTISNGDRHSPSSEILARDDVKFNNLKEKQTMLYEQMENLSEEQKELVKEARNLKLFCSIHIN